MIALLAIAALVGIYNFVDFGTSSANSLRLQTRSVHANVTQAQEIQRPRTTGRQHA